MIYNATSNSLSSVPLPVRPLRAEYQQEYYYKIDLAEYEFNINRYRSSCIQCADECRESWKDYDGKEVPEGMYIQQYERLNTSGGWMKTTKQIYNNTMGCYRRIIAYPKASKIENVAHAGAGLPSYSEVESILHKEEKDLLPNLAASTANLSHIKDKDEWMREVRGDEEPAQPAGQEYKKIKRIAECAFNSVITIEGSAGFESWWKEELKINKWLQGLIGEPLPPYSETVTTSEGQPAAEQETGVDEEEATFVQKHLVRFKEKFEENRAYLAAQSLEEAAKAFAMRKIGYRTLDNHDQWDDSKETFCVVAKSPEVAAYHYPEYTNLQKTVERLAKEKRELKEELAMQDKEIERLRKEIELLVSESAHQSKSIVKYHEENQHLQSQLTTLQEENEILRQSRVNIIEAMEGEFAEWASEHGYSYYAVKGLWHHSRDGFKSWDDKTKYTTADLYAEFKKKGGEEKGDICENCGDRPKSKDHNWCMACRMEG